MKTIDRIEIEYVVPETEKEKEEIDKILKDAKKNKNSKKDLSDYKIVDNSGKPEKGYWRKKGN
jgi:hypothetical protein